MSETLSKQLEAMAEEVAEAITSGAPLRLQPMYSSLRLMTGQAVVLEAKAYGNTARIKVLLADLQAECGRLAAFERATAGATDTGSMVQ